MTSQIFAALAAAGLVTAGVAASAETRAVSSLPLPVLAAGATGGQCTVNVIRTGTPGEANVTRQQLDDGSCVCNVLTGPSESNGNAEGIVRQLQQTRECADAPVGAEAGQAASSAGAGGGVLGILVGSVGAGGLVVAVSKKSPG
ncbi:hypothetical protein [Novosphingobium sp. TH158]|uniref:hypothetical protein n=1 Tax=Novosphingobium sp. TH158 TaxID=2067455 RepID=UPI000C7CBED0|nr:hypothetical protein [Novosphingobium sp. TH158]PLK27109.1 hypothetical protein C0V78_09600 [Novosphingobium sp. TH158]